MLPAMGNSAPLEPRVSIAIMHHPARPEVLARLEADLEAMGAEYEVVVDPEPYGPTSPWRTAREAWRRTPTDCTHRLVLQDDALICDEFPYGVHLALSAQPDWPVSFFVNFLGYQCARAQLDACERCDAWAWLPLNSWYPTVATALPRDMALSLAAFDAPRRQIADDAVLAQWANARKVRVLQTVPSLVQHDEDAISTIAGHVSRARNRGAACFIGDYAPDEVPWHRGPR